MSPALSSVQYICSQYILRPSRHCAPLMHEAAHTAPVGEEQHSSNARSYAVCLQLSYPGRWGVERGCAALEVLVQIHQEGVP
eukprot:scaffold1318_cov388-Prasinococcus_capsulatus_cf.AAC.24